MIKLIKPITLISIPNGLIELQHKSYIYIQNLLAMDQYAKNELEVIKQYDALGYNSNFYIKNGTLHNSDSDASIEPKNINVVAEHRFEGMSNPSDLSILYVIQTKDSKGTILVPYGPNADSDTVKFINSIPKENVSESMNIFLNSKD